MSLSNPHKNWNHLEYFNKKNSICQRGWTEATPKKHHTLTKLPQLEHSILNLSIKVGWQLLKGGRSGKIPWFEIVQKHDVAKAKSSMFSWFLKTWGDCFFQRITCSKKKDTHLPKVCIFIENHTYMDTMQFIALTSPQKKIPLKDPFFLKAPLRDGPAPLVGQSFFFPATRRTERSQWIRGFAFRASMWPWWLTGGL